MQALTPLVEPLSIDEAFPGSRRHRAPARHQCRAQVLASFAREVERDIGITVSVGLSRNKFLAKIASDLDKPRGFAVLDQDEARTLLAPKARRLHLWRRPRDAGAACRSEGFRTIADLQRAEETELMKRFGDEGRRLWRLARGIDNRKVDARPRRQDDLERDHVRDRHPRISRRWNDVLWRLSENASPRASRAAELSGIDDHAEAEDQGFPPAHARSHSISAPTQLAAADLLRSRAICWRRRSTARRFACSASASARCSPARPRRRRRPHRRPRRRMPSARWTICAAASATPRSSRGWRSGKREATRAS